MDNVFTERLWRSLKYEEVYINDYESVRDAKEGISRYINFYNRERPHQSLGYRTPPEVYLLRKSKVVNGTLNIIKYYPTNGVHPKIKSNIGFSDPSFLISNSNSFRHWFDKFLLF